MLYTYASLLPSTVQHMYNLHAETTRLAYRINGERGTSVHSAGLSVPLTLVAFFKNRSEIFHTCLTHGIPRSHFLISLLRSLTPSTLLSHLSRPWHAGGWWFDPRPRQTKDVKI